MSLLSFLGGCPTAKPQLLSKQMLEIPLHNRFGALGRLPRSCAEQTKTRVESYQEYSRELYAKTNP
jgi:hypothetical protein